VGNLALQSGNVPQLQSSGAIKQLAADLLEPHLSLLGASASAIGNISTDEGRLEAVQAGAVPTLINLANHREAKIRKAACQALSNLAVAPETHAAFAPYHEAMIPVLVDQLLNVVADEDQKDAQHYAAKVR
jgi:hypothetical protein